MHAGGGAGIARVPDIMALKKAVCVWIVHTCLAYYFKCADGSLTEAGLRECAGTEEFLDGQGVLLFEGCQHVRGSLIINHHSINNDKPHPVMYQQLLLLQDVHEIDGYLLLEGLNHSDITDLRFLRRLQVIHGHHTYQLHLFGVQHYSLVVQDNPHLQTLSLASLCSIENGGVRIQNNPELCLVDTVSVGDYLVNSDLSRIGGYRYDCSGVDCHEQCVQTSGCWGTLPDECVACRGYQYLDTCVETCNLSISYPSEDPESQECVPLFPSTPSSAQTPDTPPVHITATLNDHTHAHSTNDDHTPTSITPGNVQTQPSAVLPSSVSVSVLVFVLLLLVLIGLLYVYVDHSKRKRKMSLLIQHTEIKVASSGSQYSGADDYPKQVMGLVLDSSGSSCTHRKSQVSLSSLTSSKSKTPEYDILHDQAEGREVTTEVTPRVSVTTETDSGCFEDTNQVPRLSPVSTRMTNVDPTSYQPMNEAMGPYDSKPHPPSQHCPWGQGSEEQPHSASPTSDKMTLTNADTDLGDSITCGRGSVSPSTDQHSSSLFPNWKTSAGNTRFSPAVQRPRTMGGGMGGVYSTGHHRHLSNHSHPLSHRGSLTSSHGTGTSARTSRSGSQQFGSSSSSTGYGSGSIAYSSSVFGMRDSKTPSH